MNFKLLGLILIINLVIVHSFESPIGISEGNEIFKLEFFKEALAIIGFIVVFIFFTCYFANVDRCEKKMEQRAKEIEINEIKIDSINLTIEDQTNETQKS